MAVTEYRVIVPREDGTSEILYPWKGLDAAEAAESAFRTVQRIPGAAPRRNGVVVEVLGE